MIIFYSTACGTGEGSSFDVQLLHLALIMSMTNVKQDVKNLVCVNWFCKFSCAFVVTDVKRRKLEGSLSSKVSIQVS